MNIDEITKKISLEMESISKQMKAIIDNNQSTYAFVKEMYNNYKIICL